MWIKLAITIITLFLLFDEYFKVVDKVKKKNRRKIILTALGFLSVLSLIDVFIEVKENDELVEKANTIISQSDTLISNTNSLNSDLQKNIKSVEASGQSIKLIDSLLNDVKNNVYSQVDILDNVVNKSKELLALEELKFKQDESKVISYNSDVILKKNDSDSTLYEIRYLVINSGIRKAIDLKIEDKTLLYNEESNKFTLLDISENTFFSQELQELPYNTKLGQSIRLRSHSKKLLQEFDRIFLIVKCVYKDGLTGKRLVYYGHFISDDLSSPNVKFTFLGDKTYTDKLNQKLGQENLKEFMLDYK
jgi:hypothetical protein